MPQDADGRIGAAIPNGEDAVPADRFASGPSAGVDWSRYAVDYDRLAVNNPAYRQIQDDFRQRLATWNLPREARLLDLGAGTGNFSLAAASQEPRITVYHLDRCPQMNGAAQRKAASLGLRNVQFVLADAEEFELEPASLHGVIAVHSLGLMRDPPAAIDRLAGWLRPGGRVFACDVGRLLDRRDWRNYLFEEIRRSHGFLAASRMLLGGRSASTYLREFAAAQRSGRYWLHPLREFRQSFLDAGLEVTESYEAFRGYSDVVVALKPQ